MNLEVHLQTLQDRHANLEKAIHDEMTRPAPDDGQVRDLKRQKLQIKEEITRVQSSH